MKLIEITLTIQIEDDTDWEAAAEEVFDAACDSTGDLVLSVDNWKVGEFWTQT